MRCRALVLCFVAAVVVAHPCPVRAQGGPSKPVLFVTQMPVGGFASMTSTFGNHLATMDSAPRGGDLVIRYPDGSLRFLTQEAGFGNAGMQGANAIAVREPCVHWSGTKALFAMVVGAPTQQYQVASYSWQIYEVSGLVQGATATIRHIANQPVGFNNVSPIYATDGRILFTSDRPPSGAAHLYPQRDEYESAFTVAGIYALDESTGDLELLEHSPSGSFSPSIDSFGRVVFTKWDHLQRDQQGDAPDVVATYQAFTWASEAANAATTTTLAGAEVFPEPRSQNDPAYSPALSLHTFNHFFPWELNEDGTAEETLNHVGRHELGGSYTDGSFTADPNLTYYVDPSLHANQLYIRGDGGLLQLREDPSVPGDFLATDAPEFGTAAGGTLMRLTGAPSINAEDMVLTAVTPTSNDAQVPQQTGYFRNPLPMSDGTLLAVHTAATGQLQNLGNTAAPNWSYQYRLKILTKQGSFFAPVATLTGGIQKSLSWWTPDTLASYNGTLWELDPVEVMARPAPSPRQETLPSIEAGVFAQEAVDVASFETYLRDNGLALIVSRNVTQRDRADRSQPFNLRVPGGVSSIATSGTAYDVAYLQVFQGDALRGYGDPASPHAGRRLLARPMHEAGVSHAAGGPAGAVTIAPDGSFAALVPARRALSWQLTDGSGEPVVRERNWLSMQAGEIRVCASCHGINTLSQTGAPPPTNEPEALHELLAQWKQQQGGSPGNPTATPTRTASPAPGTATKTPTPAATKTPTPAATKTPTPAATKTPTPAATKRPTPAATKTATPAPGATKTATPAATTTATPLGGGTPIPPVPSATATPGNPDTGSCSSGIAIERARLRTDSSAGSMRMVGRTLIPPPWIAVAPPTNGVRVAIEGVLDLTVPGGAGWTTSASGKRWRFDDRTGALGGLRHIEIVDQSSQAPGRLTFELRFVGAPLLPGAGPVDLALQFGNANECAAAHWNAANGARPRCRGTAQRLTCS